MDSPFFTNHWNFPSRARGIPVQPKTTPSRKVVSIPVRFVGSGRSRSDSALKIQKVFRGFLVRKSARKIAAIRREVDEIERKISEKVTMESVRSDPKERLRVNETLMSLLFKLDSVRGVDSGVRDCRKAVIKRAIALQELVDAIVSGERSVGPVDEAPEAEAVHPKQEISRVDDDELPGKASEFETFGTDLVDNCCNLSADHETLEELENDVVNSVPNSVDSERINVAESMPNSRMPTLEPDETLKLQDPEQAREKSEKVDLGGVDVAGTEMEAKDGEMIVDSVPNSAESDRKHVVESTPNVEPEETLKLQAPEQACENSEKVGGDDAAGTEMEAKGEEIVEENEVAPSASKCAEESVGTSQTKSQSGSSADPESLVEGVEENSSKQEEKMNFVEKYGSVGEDCGGSRGREESKRSRELLEKMMEDNERMMGVMAELFVRNEMQTRLLSSLSQRVELLERASICEKLRRKKKRHAAGAVDDVKKLPDTRNCGKR